MKNFISLFFVSILFVATSISQNKKEVLMTVNSQPVYVSEFTKVYNKNLDLVQDESQKDIDTYLGLFKDYKLKVAEAYAQKLDKNPSYTREFSEYQDQLSRNYILENTAKEELAREAYERSKEEIKAAHILIKVGFDDTSQDTLVAYNKIKEIRQKALNGEDFSALAKKNSEEPNADKTGGSLEYFTVFNLVYPFETEAYNTKVGQISKIVRTSYGYHIIKVLDRRDRAPFIKVSHIMIGTKGGERTFDPEERVNEIYKKLQQGESFESLAKQFSDDKSSAKNGGALNKFSKGDLRSPEFENAAYSIKKVGEYTRPIKTDFGWHIIRLDQNFGTPSFEDEKDELEKRVSEGDRSKVVTNAINEQIKNKYGFKKTSDVLPFFENLLSDEVLIRKWVLDSSFTGKEKIIFTIGKKNVTYLDFANFISSRQKTTRPYKNKAALVKDLYDEFETDELKNYFKEQLEFENEDYAAILNEYRNGLLIFDVMNKNIWDKAKNDTIALEKFYELHKSEYNWKARSKSEIVSANSKDLAKQVQALMNAGKSKDEIRDALNTDGKINVIVSGGSYEMGDKELPNNFVATVGVSEVYTVEDSFVVVHTTEVIAPSSKTFDEVKGKVISDYQNTLEQEWMQSLRNKYTINVNQKELKKVKKQLKK